MKPNCNRKLDSESSNLHLQYLSFLHSLTGGSLVLVHFSDIIKPLQASLDIWCPVEVFNSYSQSDTGIVCVKNLKTPLGLLSKARLRETDIVALEILDKHNVC